MADPAKALLRFLRRKARKYMPERESQPPTARPVGLAVLAIMKNEAMNLDEWISHYRQVGVDRIVLIDNGSTDNSLEKARAWAEQGGIDLVSRPMKYSQTQHYWEAFDLFIKGRYEWLMVADLDEFWFCPDGTPIREKLAEKNFASLDVIYANWTMFGSSGFQDHPASLRRQLLYRAGQRDMHQNTKFICRTSVLRRPENLGIHKVFGADSSRTVSDNDSFRLFHYPIQSLEFFTKVKMTRGDATAPNLDTVRDMAYFRAYDAPCTVKDRTLADLVEQDRLGKA